jgi:hypothetical protein
LIRSINRCVGGALLACALLVTPCASAADRAISDEAQKHFSAGVSLLQDPDGARYEDAYREFEAAYSASGSPKILGNIGFCALKLERDGDAIESYNRYLHEVPDIDPVEAAQIGRDLATLRAGVVRVIMTIDAPNASIIDKRLPVRGDSITNLYAAVDGKIDIGVRPGHHIVEVKTGAETLDVWEFDAKPAATLSRAVARKPAEPQRRSSSQLVPWVVTGIGAATMAAGGVFGVVTLAKVNTIGSHCPNSECPPTYALSAAQEDARHFIRITDTVLIGGAVIAVTGVGLLLFSGGSEAPRPPAVGPHPATSGSQPRPLPQASLTCFPGTCFATMSGAF